MVFNVCSLKQNFTKHLLFKKKNQNGCNTELWLSWFILYPQASTSARQRTCAKERNHWMASTGLGTKSSTTGGCLIVFVVWFLSCICYSWCSSHRYLRFFPDGQVIMLTTPEDPLAVVHRLRTKNTRYSCILSWKVSIVTGLWFPV